MPLFDDLRGQAQGWLVEQEQAGAGHQGAAHRQHLLLAPREQGSSLAAPLCQDREQGEYPFPRLGPRGLGRGGVHSTGSQVLLDGEPTEDPPAFRRLHDAAADCLGGIQLVDANQACVLVVLLVRRILTSRSIGDRSLFDPATMQSMRSGDGPEQRALTGPVATEDGDHTVVRDFEGNAFEGLDRPVAHDQIVDFEHVRRGLLGGRWRAAGSQVT
jgi:hypothetical protein